MPWFVGGLVANAAIMVVEYMNRSYGLGFAAILPYTFVFIVLGQWGLHHSWSNAPSMMAAWAFFSAGNSAFRLLSNHFVLREPMSWKTVVLVAMMMACAWLIKVVK